MLVVTETITTSQGEPHRQRNCLIKQQNVLQLRNTIPPTIRHEGETNNANPLQFNSNQNQRLDSTLLHHNTTRPSIRVAVSLSHSLVLTNLHKPIRAGESRHAPQNIEWVNVKLQQAQGGPNAG